MSRARAKPTLGAAARWLLVTGLAGVCAVDVEPAFGQVTSTDRVSVTGTVVGRFGTRAAPLPGAWVLVLTAEGRRSVEADERGQYVLTDLPSSPVELRVSHAGYEAVSLIVRGNGDRTVIVDIELIAAPISVPGLRVRTDSNEPRDAEEAAGRSPDSETRDPELEVKLLEISPSLGEAGIAHAVQGLPGNDPSDPTDVLFMRGSTSDMKLVLLDGVPVFTPFHVAGLLRSFEPTVLGRADLHVGGAPARYDGGLTHILDLRTRSPRRDRIHATGSVDLLSASVAAEIPLGERAGMLASARALHDLGRAPLGGERPYGYGDMLLSVEADPGTAQRLRATGFWNGESVRLDFARRPEDARWSNRAGSLSYEGEIGPTTIRVTTGASRYDATLPLQPTPTTDDPTPEAILATALSDRARVVSEAVWDRGGASDRVGLSFERFDASFAAETFSGSERSASRGTSTAVGAFLETVRGLGPGVTGRMGVRGDLFSGQPLKISPRVALFWELGPDAMLSIAAGRYHQVTRTTDSRVDEALSAFATDDATPGELLPVATADHVVLSLDQRLAGSVSLGIEGFWKAFEGLTGATGSVRSSGLDLQVLSNGANGTVWLGYGLSWFWSPTDLSGRTSDFAGRHLLSAGVSGQLLGPLRGEARLAYGAGLPATSIPFGSASEALSGPEQDGGLDTLAGRTGEPILPSLDESFLRLDLEIHAVFEPAWGARTWRVRPYLRLLNALDRRDALFYAYQPWRPDSVTPLATRPILPVLGVAFSF
ncbi:MAG: TonB-dependent receptor [Gemmatimonadota bacterium]|nr:TonB-dependent receptor [Gemmatimonadota bacterium]